MADRGLESARVCSPNPLTVRIFCCRGISKKFCIAPSSRRCCLGNPRVDEARACPGAYRVPVADDFSGKRLLLKQLALVPSVGATSFQDVGKRRQVAGVVVHRQSR